MRTSSEENYLKALYQIGYEQGASGEAGTNELAAELGLKPATVNEMLKRLKEKAWVDYEKYGKIRLTHAGRTIALEIIRKHRLWETFLLEKLEFTWDEVHEVAEQLEHIQSRKLVDQIDKLLGFPSFDPHGDPIPNAEGEVAAITKRTLAELSAGASGRMVGVKDDTASFLQYLDTIGLALNRKIRVVARNEYDGLLQIDIEGQHSTVSPKFAEHIWVVEE